MKAFMNPDEDWRHVATVEVSDASGALEHVIDNHPSCYRIKRNRKCPADCSSFDILVAFGIEHRDAAHAAYAVLTAAQKAAEKGTISGCRFICAQYWGELAYILGHDAPAETTSNYAASERSFIRDYHRLRHTLWELEGYTSRHRRSA